MTRDDAEQTYLNRRSVIAASGAVGVAGLAGCTGDGGEGTTGDEEGAVENEQDTNGGTSEFDQPDFVADADPVFGRMEADWGEGEVTTELRLEEELEDPDEASGIVMLQDGEQLLEGRVSSTVDIPIAEWSDSIDEPFVGDIEVQIQNDFGDTLASMEWNIDGSLEITEVGIVHENVDFLSEHFEDINEESNFPFVRVRTEGDVAYIGDAEIRVEPYDVDASPSGITSPDDGEYAAHQDASTNLFDNDVGLLSGEALLLLEGANVSPQGGECEPGSGEIILNRPVSDDVTVDIEVGDGEETGDLSGSYCAGADINIIE